MLARDYKEGVHPPFKDSTGGAQAGHVMIYDAPTSSGDMQAKLPTGTTPYLSPPVGINQSAGFVGGSGTQVGQDLAITRQGLTKVLLTAGLTTTRGQFGEADPNSLGNVRGYTLYSRSAWLLGWFEEAYSASSTDDPVEFYAQPHFLAVVRSINGYAATAPTAGATKYANGIGSVANAQIPLYVAGFAGERVRNLKINLGTAPASGESLTATLQKSSDNGSSWTDLTVTAAISGTGKAARDTSHSDALAAGDLVALKLEATNNGSYAAAAFSYSFDIT